MLFCFFFFFKQKTAYEMRISDWSSDVCSSDLLTVGSEVLADLGLGDLPIAAIAKGPDRGAGRERIFLPGRPSFMLQPRDPALYFLQRLRDEAHRFAIGTHRAGRSKARLRSALDEVPGRSDEHSSELQSLMRIPYAVFCLKKKT